MEFLRAGEAIWRTRSAIRPFRSPVTKQPHTFRRAIDPSRVCWSCRLFSIQSVRQQQAVVRAPAPEPAEETASDNNSQLNNEDRAFLNDGLELKHQPGVSAKHTQRFHSRTAQETHRTPSTFVPIMKPGVHLKPPPGDSYNDALKFRQQSLLQASRWGRTSSEFDNMKAPSGSFANPTTAVTRPLPRREVGQLRLSSRTGKTLDVIPNESSDLALKLKRLQMTVVRNRIPQDFQKQRFHERPGLKRKRLKSQRWRARFKKGFSKIVGRVGEMRKMGW